MVIVDSSVVALLGMVGHGKTCLLNKTCRTNHPSDARAKSCTMSLQFGKITRGRNKGDIVIIDTPGIGATDDVTAHLAAQQTALEGIPLSGVYAVVKFGRAADIARIAESVMDFLGTDDIRIIVTHCDIHRNDAGYDEDGLKVEISNVLDLPTHKICMIGKDTPGTMIQDFITRTLHPPIQFEITDVQIAAFSTLSGVRKFNKPINAVQAKIKVATQACEDIVYKGKTYETDLAIIATQTATSEMVAQEKENIMKDALENLSLEQQNLVYGKAGVGLSLALQHFMKSTNRFLRWDVTDPQDARNQYRKCPHCDAVYAKEGGCETMNCGDVNHVPPKETQSRTSSITATFSSTGISFLIGGAMYCAKMAAQSLLKYTRKLMPTQSSSEEMRLKLEAAKAKGTRELNIFCHKSSRWSEMLPLKEEEFARLGDVEFIRQGPKETLSRVVFKRELKKSMAKNKALLRNELAHIN